MDKFDRYDEIEYTGKSNPNVWEIHLEFFFSKTAALRRYAAIRRLHREATKRQPSGHSFGQTGRSRFTGT
jgi:hypothetical protein